MSKKENGVVIKKKSFRDGNGRLCKATLEKEDGFFVVKLNGEIYKKTANELFAVQYFNAL